MYGLRTRRSARPTATAPRTPLCAALCVVLWVAATAQESEQTLEVEADSVTFNENTGVSVYRGDVKIVRGEITLRGDAIEVLTKDGAVSRLISTAKPSRLVHNEPERTLRAEALRIEYQAAQGIIDLRGAARIHDDRKSLAGDHIIYDTRKKIVKAMKGENRVKLTLQPEKKNRR